MARTTLLRDYGIPTKFAEALLPRFSSRIMPLHPYPVHVNEGVFHEHKEGTFERYYNLRC